MAATEPRRILVTGASGFVGRHLLPALEASFAGVEVFERSFSTPVEILVTRQCVSLTASLRITLL